MPEHLELLACGHPYILNVTGYHTISSCMKCIECCTCKPISVAFREAEENLKNALADLRTACERIDRKEEQARRKQLSKADHQRLEQAREDA